MLVFAMLNCGGLSRSGAAWKRASGLPRVTLGGKEKARRLRAESSGASFKATEGVRPVVTGTIRPLRALACNGGALLSKVRRATLRHGTAEDQQDCVTG